MKEQFLLEGDTRHPFSFSWHPAIPSKMADRFAQCYCDLCGFYTYKSYMTEREDGLFCPKCAELPPYSDALYDAILALQGLFRKHFEKRAKPCGKCEKPSLKRTDFLKDCEPICECCLEDELDKIREEMDCRYCDSHPCRCDEDDGWCSDCEGQWGCVCIEQKVEASLMRHQRICGDKNCDGTCGTLDCGCIDVCRGRYATCAEPLY